MNHIPIRILTETKIIFFNLEWHTLARLEVKRGEYARAACEAAYQRRPQEDEGDRVHAHRAGVTFPAPGNR